MLYSIMHATPKLLAVAAFSLASTFGPPRISVKEVTPADHAPAGVVLIVHGHHHTDSASMPITGRAEGLQSGRRVTMPLVLVSTADGRYGLTRQWAVGTAWVLVLAVGEGEAATHGGLAEALVKIDVSGKVVGIDFPAAGWTGPENTPKRTNEDTIRSMLTTLASRR
jgi:hypothetical protein